MFILIAFCLCLGLQQQPTFAQAYGSTISSTWQEDCVNECTFGGNTNYMWCYIDVWQDWTLTGLHWDYCSPVKDVTYHGKACRPDHSCDYHGKSYAWCWEEEEGSWGYCSLTDTKRHCENCFFGLDHLGYFCTSDCTTSPNGLGFQGEDLPYSWCLNYNSWGYCTYKINKDVRGNRCRSDHLCDKHGYSYYWCYNDIGGWDYCSPQLGCTYAGPRFKRGLEGNQSSEEVDRFDNCVVNIDYQHVIERVDDGTSGIKQDPNPASMRDARIILAGWDDGVINPRNPGTITEGNHVHLEYQSSYSKDGFEYAILQISINVIEDQSENEDEVKIASLHVPIGFPITSSYIRESFLISLESHKNVRITVNLKK